MANFKRFILFLDSKPCKDNFVPNIASFYFIFILKNSSSIQKNRFFILDCLIIHCCMILYIVGFWE